MARNRHKSKNNKTNQGKNTTNKQTQKTQKTSSNSNSQLIDDIKKQLIQKLISKL